MTTQKIAFDPVLKRPGCALIQAAMGCNPTIAQAFPSETWLVMPTDHMQVFEATEDQLVKLIAMAEAAIAP